MVKVKDSQFSVKNLKMKRKKDKTFLTFQSGDLKIKQFEPQIFSNFPRFEFSKKL